MAPRRSARSWRPARTRARAIPPRLVPSPRVRRPRRVRHRFRHPPVLARRRLRRGCTRPRLQRRVHRVDRLHRRVFPRGDARDVSDASRRPRRRLESGAARGRSKCSEATARTSEYTVASHGFAETSAATSAAAASKSATNVCGSSEGARPARMFVRGRVPSWRRRRRRHRVRFAPRRPTSSALLSTRESSGRGDVEDFSTISRTRPPRDVARVSRTSLEARGSRVPHARATSATTRRLATTRMQRRGRGVPALAAIRATRRGRRGGFSRGPHGDERRVARERRRAGGTPRRERRTRGRERGRRRRGRMRRRARRRRRRARQKLSRAAPFARARLRLLRPCLRLPFRLRPLPRRAVRRSTFASASMRRVAREVRVARARIWRSRTRTPRASSRPSDTRAKVDLAGGIFARVQKAPTVRARASTTDLDPSDVSDVNIAPRASHAASARTRRSRRSPTTPSPPPTIPGRRFVAPPPRGGRNRRENREARAAYCARAPFERARRWTRTTTRHVVTEDKSNRATAAGGATASGVDGYPHRDRRARP